MTLTNEKILALIDGAIDWEEDSYGIRPLRFLRSQIEAAAKSGEDSYTVRQRASASISLDFDTDATAIELDAHLTKGAGQSCYSFDLYLDGVLADAVHGVYDEHGTDVSCRFALGKGAKHVQIYLPNLASVCITRFALEEASYARRRLRKERILFLGDSITQGYTARLTSLSYANTLARMRGASVLNQAIGGDVFEASHLCELPYKPDLVLVAYGTNDFSLGRDISVTAGAYFERLCALYGKERIVCLLPISRMDGREEGGTQGRDFLAFRERLGKIAASYGVRAVETLPLLPAVEPFFSDLVHPSDLGFQHYANALSFELAR